MQASVAADPDPTVVHRALDAGADPRRPAAAALQHRIAALLWRALDRASVAETPAEERRSLAQDPKVLHAEAPLLHLRAVSLALRPPVDAARRWVALRSRLLRASDFTRPAKEVARMGTQRWTPWRPGIGLGR
jgi:hypothetical protein